MLILTLIDVQYSQKAVFSFEKGLNCPNHPSPGSLHLVTPPPPIGWGIYHPPFTAIWKALQFISKYPLLLFFWEFSSNIPYGMTSRF